MTAASNSYSQVLRSSSIVGGAQAVNYAMALVRVKLIAMLLGPTGVGLIGLYTSALGMVGTVSGLGVRSSAVREIVRAYSKEDGDEAARTVRVLRRVCWATGLLGWLLAILFSEPISAFITGSPKHAGAIALLGSTLLIGAVSSGQLALLQGLRRIGDLARANVAGALAGSVVSLLIYSAWRENGIVPAMIATALVSLGCSYWFAKRIAVTPVAVNWTQTLQGFRGLVLLGLAFMWVGVIGASQDMLTRAIITRKMGLEAVGIYQAAWSLSGIFASFVLSAMGADFYPRLTGAVHDKVLAAKEVNEQTEIGVLVALPGLLASIAFAPIAIRLLYTRQFIPAAELLPWMTLGVFGQIVSWPLGYVQVAKGAARTFAATETLFVGVQTLLTFGMVDRFGLIGAAYAVAVSYLLYTLVMLLVTHRLISFAWSVETRRLILLSVVFMIATLLVRAFLPDLTSLVGAGALTLAGALFSLRGLTQRLGEEHRLVRWLLRVPGGNYLLTRQLPTVTLARRPS